jgi:hypothetical protein
MAIFVCAVAYALIIHGVPYLARQVVGPAEFALPVPAALRFMYLLLIVVGALVYVSYSEGNWQEFLRPVTSLLAGRYGIIPKFLVMLLFPLLLGWGVFASGRGGVASPAALWIQHPSSNFPRQYESWHNPLREPSPEILHTFTAEAKDGMYDVIPTAPMQAFLNGIKSGKSITEVMTRAALQEKYLYEGRILYQINCRPCHGTKADGNGPMAEGFRPRRPINFTDVGTIETLVEGYAWWRVKTGGLGLPSEASPWDSAMPVWGRQLAEHVQDLSDEQIYKILLAEYATAGKDPRLPE